MQTIKNFNFNNERAIIRVDFNVPLSDKLEVTDKTRIEAAKQTISYILSNGGSCVLISHLGRPKEGPKIISSKYFRNSIYGFGVRVKFSSTCVGGSRKKAKNLKQERFY